MKKIAPDVFQIPLMPRNSINAYLIEDVVIDAGIRSSANLLLKNLKNYEVNTHALTHAHADHQGSSKRLCENHKIPLWCSASEVPQAESGLVTVEYPNAQHFISRFQQRFWAGEGQKVSKIIKEGDTVGGFRVVDTPGHSSGHVSFFREKDGVLIVGDVMTNMNLLTTIGGLHEPPTLFTQNRELNRQSIKKLAALKPKILCFGHGAVLFNKNEWQIFVGKL